MLLTLLFLTLATYAVPPAKDDAAANAFRDTLERMQGVVESINDLTTTFYQREWVDGEMTPETVIEVKWRRAEDLVLRYVGNEHTGRVVVWQGPEHNESQIRVNPGRFLPTLSLAYDGALATRGQRHTIRDLPVTKLAKLIIDGAMKVNDHPVWLPAVTDLGETTVRGEASRCFDTATPKAEDPTLYAYRVKLCVSPTTGLPNTIQVWDHEDGEIRLVEDYAYIGTQTNVGLTDADFAWDNAD